MGLGGAAAGAAHGLRRGERRLGLGHDEPRLPPRGFEQFSNWVDFELRGAGSRHKQQGRRT